MKRHAPRVLWAEGYGPVKPLGGGWYASLVTGLDLIPRRIEALTVRGALARAAAIVDDVRREVTTMVIRDEYTSNLRVIPAKTELTQWGDDL